MKKFTLIIKAGALLLLSVHAYAQQPATTTTTTTTPQATPATTPTVITWSGYVKTDYFFDSRQTVNAREGDFMMAPAKFSPDANGKDINAVPSFNALSIQSRLRVGVTGPDFFGYKTSAAIEGEFFGHTDADINGFRLRHAYIQLTGTKSQMLLGQFWHPFFVPECFPGTYNFSTGEPFATISRQPQFRLSSVGPTKAFIVLMGERDFKAAGASVATTGIPQIAGGIQHTKGGTVLGVNFDYKIMKPQMSYTTGTPAVVYMANHTLSAFSAQAYLRHKAASGLTFKIQANYLQNGSDLLLPGGFGLRTLASGTSETTYTNIPALTTWTELEGAKGNLEWGVFAGYLKNLGAKDDLASATINQWSLVNDLITSYRVAPRIGWKMGKGKIGMELDYQSATRGAIDLSKNKRALTELASHPTTSNVRLLVTAQYNF